ncbi:hypothetical protein LZC95_06165 [Pendulispora brunnea]|uniref:DUF5602 domain-containing protein n=1 Tax=Pendulispora brunnea TaxID=2905690 RepID=A0ABZ2KCK4_9BACT
MKIERSRVAQICAVFTAIASAGSFALASGGCSQSDDGDHHEDDLHTGDASHQHTHGTRVCFNGQQMLLGDEEANILVSHGGSRGNCELVENRLSLGQGYVQSVYQLNDDGSPKMIGITIDEKGLQTLPTNEVNDGATCWDNNNDGVINRMTECSGGHERVMWFPDIKDLPIKWMMFNWQGHGHAPEGVFSVPHFDLHYFIMDYVERNYMRTGPCDQFIPCPEWAKAAKDIPIEFWPPGYLNAKGIQGRMGNHMINKNSPEWQGKGLAQAFAYGLYDGHISFWEPVTSVDWLKGNPNECKPVIQQPNVEIRGWYAKTYCSRHRPDRHDYLMSLEDFAFREAYGGDASIPPPVDAGPTDSGMHDHDM